MKLLSPNTSYKAHGLLGLAVGLWVVAFLIFISPFDVVDLTLKNKFILLPPYGLGIFICYLFSVFIQNKIFFRDKSWSIGRELFIHCVFLTILLAVCFLYYKSKMMNGEYSFVKFLFITYLPVLVVVEPIVVAGRAYLRKIQFRKTRNKVLLKGTNKNDVLQIELEKIVVIASAQNYIEVTYITDEKLDKKLLRIPLKKIASEMPELIQVHRSYLVNPAHFVKWKNSKIAIFHDKEVPISRNYKKVLECSI